MDLQEQSYKQLFRLSKEIKIFSGVTHLIEWDQETYMPPGAASIRSEQLEALASLIHKKKTSTSFKKILSKLVDIPSGRIKSDKLSLKQRAALREWHNDYVKATKLPTSFVKSFAKLSSESITAWKSAKQNNSFIEFQPYLERIIAMSRKKAELLKYKDHPYDALLDEYEPGETFAHLSSLFNQIKDPIIKLLKKITSKKPAHTSILEGKFPIEKQLAFSHQMLKEIGYSDQHGRLDLSAHPFSSACHPSDSRITTRINEKTISSNILTVLHEFGHALYEMGLPSEEYGSPLGQSISLGIHESQSRFWETRIGQSNAFWKYFLPKLKKSFPGKLDNVSVSTFVKAINNVKPSLIRVEADEVTYPLHVMLRFDLEKQLIEGSLKVEDLPEAWNEKMEEYLGITPFTDAQGCLQDIHWSMGALGYFPTYALGNIYAAHLFEKFAKDHPDWEKNIAEGHFLFLRQWLHKSIHQYGREYSSLDLLKKVTGKTLSAKAYLDYLQKKYS